MLVLVSMVVWKKKPNPVGAVRMLIKKGKNDKKDK